MVDSVLSVAKSDTESDSESMADFEFAADPNSDPDPVTSILSPYLTPTLSQFPSPTSS